MHVVNAQRVALCLSVLVLLGWSGLSQALKFAPGVDAKGRKILWVRDCNPRKESCQTFERMFSPGDEARLNMWLARNRYAEIWFHSGGGSLMEGVKIGYLLRRKRQFVRVPEGKHCVSACTVAFLGGVLRQVDPGASYQVHAYSSERAKEKVFPHIIPNLQNEPERGLKELAKEHAKNGRDWAAKLMIYFQRMIKGRPNQTAIRAAVFGPGRMPLYLTDGRLQRDATRIRLEGKVAIQEIYMALERESMALAIKDLRAAQNKLGTRAKHAIRMLEIMFSSRITGVAPLNQTTLREMGYVNVRSR